MFILSRLKDTIKIEAHNFGKDRELALKDELNRKYANKVLPNVGLCISLFDIEESSEGIVLYGDGCVYHKAIFRMVVFKPFTDEIILGRVGRSTKDGIKFTLGFFDDCFIPAHRLMPRCAFDQTRSEFYWAPQDEDAPEQDIALTPEDERFYIIAGETIRARVVAEKFNDTAPKVPPKAPAAPGAGPTPNPTPVDGPPPYRLECTIQEEGLGLLDWWRGGEEQDAEMAEGT